jgi:hypothetical protein
MRATRSLLLVPALALLLGGCSRFVVRSHYDVASVEREPLAKGFRRADGAAPDFLLNYRYTTTPVSAVQGDPTYGGWGDWWLVTPGWEAHYSDDFDDGALHLAVLDPAHQRAFWIGVAEARIIPTMSFERTLARIDDAVAAMLRSFPPH